jgi:hypothetical protein
MAANRTVELRGAGYFAIPDILLLTGKPEADLHAEMRRLGIHPRVRFGTEPIAETMPDD